jgi:catechol-2,3-dioxygenase
MLTWARRQSRLPGGMLFRLSSIILTGDLQRLPIVVFVRNMKADRIFETILYAEDLKKVKPFYEEVLGLKLIKESSLFLVFRLSKSVLLIFNPNESRLKDRDIPHHGTSGEGHIAFAASHQSIPIWKKHLIKHKIDIESEVRWEEGSTGLYVRDPAGNSVEFTPPTLWGGGWGF